MIEKIYKNVYTFMLGHYKGRNVESFANVQCRLQIG